jgi:predicted nucleotidyltransferase
MNEQTIRKLASVLKKDKGIVFAYLFGSSAKWPNAKAADTDIAVMLKKDCRGLKKLAAINSISAKVSAMTNNNVDVVILNGASAALRQQVVKYGRLLFEKKKGMVHAFIVDTITAYFDYLQILNFFHSKTVHRKA